MTTAVVPALEVRGLCAGYDGVAVVHDLDLRVEPGQIVALLGANGAGKTTTLATISGLLARLGGSIDLFGSSVAAHRRVRPGQVAALARQGLAHVPEDRGLFADLTVAEHLRLARRRRTTTRSNAEVFGWFPTLARLVDRRAGRLSGGEQQMLSLARALTTAPRVLLVDELSLGLAPTVVASLLPVLRRIATDTDTAMVLVEQHVDLVLGIADQAVVLQRGRVVAHGPAARIAADRERLTSGYLGTPDRREPPG